MARTEQAIRKGRLGRDVVDREGSGGTVGSFVRVSSADAPLGSRACRRFARSILEASQASN